MINVVTYEMRVGPKPVCLVLVLLGSEIHHRREVLLFEKVLQYLYTIALSMHYVEYHVMMAPRCFAAPLDGRARGDRLLAWLGSHRALFAFGLLAVPLFTLRANHSRASGGVMGVLATLLFGVSATDPLTYLATATGLALVAFLASWIPARRAARIDPVEALRSE